LTPSYLSCRPSNVRTLSAVALNYYTLSICDAGESKLIYILYKVFVRGMAMMFILSALLGYGSALTPGYSSSCRWTSMADSGKAEGQQPPQPHTHVVDVFQ
jgi:hypothetical protein